MPDYEQTHDGTYLYRCGRCGRELDPDELIAKIRVITLRGNRNDYVLICGTCGMQMFPKTGALGEFGDTGAQGE